MPKGRGIPDTLVGAVSGVAFTVACVLLTSGFHRANALADPTPTVPDATSPAWPAEIRNVWAALPASESALAVKIDQQCATVEAGVLAHCVRVQCQGVDEQAACVEIVMTARRLPTTSIAPTNGTPRPDAAPPASPLPPDASRPLHRTAQSS